MRIYLDNNATTPLHPAVLAVLDTSLRDTFGNASSIHAEGQRARQLLEQAREAVARFIGGSAREIIFTSGGTESNNAAISGAVPPDLRCHIVTSAVEHPSVEQALAALERRGCEVTRIPPSDQGLVDADAVIAAIRDDTRFVAVMLAHNETGVIQPVKAIGAVCRDRGIHFHCDAVQAAGKIAIDVEALGCDTLALSAHKMHAPKGIGALFVRSGLTMTPLLVGGSQERRRRAGTEPIPLAAAFGAAASLPLVEEQVRAMRDRLEERLRAELDVKINGENVARLPNTCNVTFRGADGEGIVIALDLEGVAVSTGSACSSGRIEPSGALLAMGLTPDEARSTVRISLSRLTTADEIERTADLLREIVPRCRRS
ncbi:MAG TPA: cysteine desulfurase family protein [Thermoanaerobaculia bacterium]